MADARVRTTPFQFRFYDWPEEQGGTAKPATADTWLYVFHVSKKAARLWQEVYLRPADGERGERYFHVDLNKHVGKDVRLPVAPGKDCCWLDDNGRHVLDEVGYYILCSPFQLPWRRFEKLAKTKDPAKFEVLAKEERGLEKVLMDADHTEPGPGSMIRIKAIWSPWGKCQGLSRQYLARLGEWEDRAMTPAKQQLRTLLSAIDMIRKGRKGGKLVDEENRPLLDEAFLAQVHADLMKDDRLHEEVVAAAKKLVDYLKGPAMTAMEDDAMAVDDVDARESFAEIRLMLETRLSQTQVGRDYRQEWFEKRNGLVLFDLAGKTGDDEKVFKTVRKAGKAIFTWAKSWADVAAGYPSGPQAGQLATKLVRWSTSQAKLARVDLRVVEISPGWSAFDKEDLQKLRDRVNERPLFSGIMAMIDAVNFAIVVRTLFESSKGDGWDRSKQAAAAASGLCSLMSSVFAYAKGPGTRHVGSAELARVKGLAAQGELSTEEAAILTEHLSHGRTRALLSQLGRWKGATKTLGALGAAADTWAGGVEMFAGMHQAKVGDSPDRIWLWPGLGMAGSALACAGYCLAFSSPAGAILVLAGSVMAMSGSLGSLIWPGIAASDTNKWLMHSFVGRHRNHALLESDTYTFGNSLAVYHTRIDLQIRALDGVLFEFTPTCELYVDNGRRRLKIDVRFRQLKAYSKVILTLFGRKKEEPRWTELGKTDDWRITIGGGGQPYDPRTKTKAEGAFPFFESIPATGYDDMKIAVQIDVLGDGTFLHPKEPKEASCKA